MMNDSGGWDTSKAFIRRQLQAAATRGRAARAANSDEMKSEAYRLLGSALHPLEDFLAHSNFLELMLIHLGHNDVFPFVGNQTQILSPAGKNVYPMVTGTFGSSDMVVSFLGGIADYLSQQSVPSLKEKAQNTTSNAGLRQKYGTQNIGKLETIQDLLGELTAQAKHKTVALRDYGPSSTRASKRERRELRDKTKRYDAVHLAVQRDLGVVASILKAVGLDKDGDGDVDEDDLTKALAKVVVLKDQVKAKVVDGFGDVVGKGVLGDLEANLDVFVSQSLQKLITPLVSLINKKVEQLMDTVITGSDAQWEVFNTTTSTDPTHSLLSKDHFRTILNEPAGLIARLVSVNTADKMVRVWENPTADVDAAISDILQCIFHPDFPQPGGSDIQDAMIGSVETWLNTMTPQDQTETLRRLTKDSIASMGNVRL